MLNLFKWDDGEQPEKVIIFLNSEHLDLRGTNLPKLLW